MRVLIFGGSCGGFQNTERTCRPWTEQHARQWFRRRHGRRRGHPRYERKNAAKYCQGMSISPRSAAASNSSSTMAQASRTTTPTLWRQFTKGPDGKTGSWEGLALSDVDVKVVQVHEPRPCTVLEEVQPLQRHVFRQATNVVMRLDGITDATSRFNPIGCNGALNEVLCAAFFCSSSKIRMNNSPMTLRFCSGSVTPLRASNTGQLP